MDEGLNRRNVMASLVAAGAGATSGCLGVLSGDQTASVQCPARTTVGDLPAIRLTGFDPGTPVTVEFVATDAMGRRFEGSWTITTDRQGTATLANALELDTNSKSISYGVDGGAEIDDTSPLRMPLHHLSPVGLFPSPPTFVAGEHHAIDMAFRAHSGLLGSSAARGTQSRVYLDSGVTRRSVETEGLVGSFYEPSTSQPYPGVVALHGAAAAVPHQLSELLATHGYATLALQYIDRPGLPDSLREVPLEYFDRAVRWLTGRSEIRDGRIGLVGISRGVEAALLTAVSREQPTTVIGYSGGGVIGYGAVGVPPRAFTSQPAWTRNGRPIARSASIEAVFDVLDGVAMSGCGVESLSKMVRSRTSETDLRDALIPVEEVNGPVLLFAGGDDRQWPSVAASALTIDRLKRRSDTSPAGLRVYCNAGHVFGVPFADYGGRATSDENGGTPEANASAAVDAWPLTLDYLDAAGQTGNS
jgi:dienelactone hydrolase